VVQFDSQILNNLNLYLILHILLTVIIYFIYPLPNHSINTNNWKIQECFWFPFPADRSRAERMHTRVHMQLHMYFEQGIAESELRF